MTAPAVTSRTPLSGALVIDRRPVVSSRSATWGDRVYGVLITTCAASVPMLLLLVTLLIARSAWPAISSVGGELVIGQTWDVARGQYGALPALLGTLASAFLALALAAPLAIGLAVFVAELAPPMIRKPCAFLLDVLASIPGVVYGLWAAYALIPLLRDRLMPLVGDTPGLRALPIFAGPAYGPSLLAASLVLAIMVLPYIAAVSRDVLLAVPLAQRHAALALGATRWEMIRTAVLPFARSGLVGAAFLGLGRALGETIAVAMVIGNRHDMPDSLFQPAYTLASLLANEFAEASADLHLSALMAVAGMLLALTLMVNAVARWLVWRMEQRA